MQMKSTDEEFLASLIGMGCSDALIEDCIQRRNKLKSMTSAEAAKAVSDYWNNEAPRQWGQVAIAVDALKSALQAEHRSILLATQKASLPAVK